MLKNHGISHVLGVETRKCPLQRQFLFRRVISSNTAERKLVVRRLKHTPNLPMPYIFSEATENREVRHILGARQEARTVKSPSGKR